MRKELSGSSRSTGFSSLRLDRRGGPGVHIGTHGWSGPDLDWMYQKSLGSIGKLSVYSQMFNAVEVDQTFYGFECLGNYKSWLDAVPDGFLFSLKTPRSITHRRKLRNPEPELSEFLKAARKLGTHLGPILIQLPSDFDLKIAESLRTFLDRLPFEEIEFAVEVRDHFLWSEQIPYLMERYPFIPVTTNLISSPEGLRTTNETAYIRWLGPCAGFEGPLKTPEQFDEESFTWSESIEQMVETSSSPNVFAFVDHEYFGPGVIGAARLRRLLGDPVHFPGALF